MPNKYKALVTGCYGFIGSHVCKKLVDEGWEVHGIDDESNGTLSALTDKDLTLRSIYVPLLLGYSREEDKKNPDVVVYQGDCAHKNILDEIKRGYFTHVFHLAAKPRVGWTVEFPVESIRENFSKSIALAYATAIGKARFIFSSTSAVYGDTTHLPTSELNSTNPNSPYGLSKLCVESNLQLFEKLYNLDWVALRYFNVYGPGQLGDSPYSTAISAWCHKQQMNEPLRSDGDGEQTRDMVYVTDVAEANYCAAITSGFGHRNQRIFNIGTGKSVNNNSILGIFKKRYDDVIVCHAPERPGDVKHTLANIENVFAYLKWSPRHNLEKGLEKTFEWWESR